LGNLLNIGKKSGKCRFESGIESSVESGCVSFNRIGEKTKMFKNCGKNNKHIVNK
jgi:hypothetical protein